MALNKAVLKAAIIAAQQAAAGAQNIAQAQDIYATSLSDAIDAYIKTGTVNTSVSTSGGPTSQTGTGVGGIT